MNRKTLIVLVLTMVTLALTLPLASASGWAQFHGNVTHTGYSTSNAPDTNHTAWMSDDIDANCASSVTIADGRIFVYCWDYLVCIDEYTGSVLWNVSIESAPHSDYTCRSWVTPAYHDGRVFLSAADTYCFNATDGAEVWNFTHPTDCGAINGGCAIAEGMVFTSDWDGRHYYCLDEDDGTEIWNFTVADDDAQSTPAISDGRVVFGGWKWGHGGHIYCVNLTTGSEEWNITTPDCPCGSAAISGDVVYMTTYDFSETRDPGELYALNIADGSIIWSQPIQRTSSTPAVAYGNVYVCGGCLGVSDLMTYCFNATTGELLWNTSASDEIGNWKCSVAVADGKVFVGKPYFEGGVMDYVGTYALNASTGEIVWNYPEGGASPAVADGMVFTIGGGRVYSFGSSIQDWAQFHYDTANTGNSPADAPDTNHVKWITEDIGAVAGSQAMIVGDMVFVYANDEVYGISRETGATIWNASIPGDTKDGGWGSWASPAYNDGALFVSAGYNLTRIDAATGTKLQEIAFSDGGYSCNGGPTVADGMVFAGSGFTPWGDNVARSHYYAFDENDLTDEKWNITNGVYESATSTPAVAANRVVFGNGSSLTCADAANGNILWSTPLVGSVGGSAAIDVFNDRVYVTTYVYGGQGTLYALNFTNGVEDWNATINYTSSTPAIHGDHIYVSGGSGDEHGHTYCFDSTGVEQWNVSCGRWTMSPAIVDGKLFTGNTDPFTSDADGISAFNATTGEPVWSYKHTGSSPSVADNLLVSIGNDGRVYAFSDILRGDANNDGSVTTADAVIALQMVVGAIPPNGEADVNIDGAVTSLDALMILQAVTGAITI